MCGRYTHLFSWAQLVRLMRLTSVPALELPLRYNVAPTQLAPIVRNRPDGEREGVMLRWGLVPFWTADPGAAGASSKMINARAETVETSPAYRRAVSQRCLVPISGFYEWQAKPGSKRKQPMYIHPTHDDLFALAGMWECWKPKDAASPSDQLETFTVLTTTPNALMAPIHDRMPVVLGPDDWARWLNPIHPLADLRPLLKPCDPALMEATPVGTQVNRPAFDHPSCIEPESDQGGQMTFL